MPADGDSAAAHRVSAYPLGSSRMSYTLLRPVGTRKDFVGFVCDSADDQIGSFAADLRQPTLRAECKSLKADTI
jgi:hypothetical protein